MPLAWVSCAGSRFRGTNREFVQSNECEGDRGRGVPERKPRHRPLLPVRSQGRSGGAEQIAELEVWNKTEVGELCDYGFQLRNDVGQTICGEVRGHERAIGWAPLVERALHMAWAALPLAPIMTLPSDTEKTK